MPDLLNIFIKRWKFILLLTLAAGIIAFLISLLSPKKFVATATALPVNVMVNERARIFSDKIQVLYSDFGTPDELDKLEGTAALDTIFMATAEELNLVEHYKINTGSESIYNAVLDLRKNSKINRSGYGELKIKVWDKNNEMAAKIANSLLQKINQIHQQLQNENSILILQRIKNDYEAKQLAYKKMSDSIENFSRPEIELLAAKKTSMLQQIVDYEKLIDQYELTINTNPQVLLTVEQAKASPWPDKPKTLPTILLAMFVAFAFAFLISLFIESRKTAL